MHGGNITGFRPWDRSERQGGLESGGRSTVGYGAAGVAGSDGLLAISSFYSSAHVVPTVVRWLLRPCLIHSQPISLLVQLYGI